MEVLMDRSINHHNKQLKIFKKMKRHSDSNILYAKNYSQKAIEDLHIDLTSSENSRTMNIIQTSNNN